ncbi:hypothetical protein HY251_03710 [bacterium]|nr:hypothetical protein [bacterium]
MGVSFGASLGGSGRTTVKGCFSVRRPRQTTTSPESGSTATVSFSPTRFWPSAWSFHPASAETPAFSLNVALPTRSPPSRCRVNEYSSKVPLGSLSSLPLIVEPSSSTAKTRPSAVRVHFPA